MMFDFLIGHCYNLVAVYVKGNFYSEGE
jgi:hypothetical protein